LAKRNCIRHVHAHFATNATTVAMLSRIMGGPSYSFTVHGPDEFTNSRRLSFGAKISNAAFVIAISKFCKKELLKLSPPGQANKIHVARCGLALDDFQQKSGVEVSHQTLVCVGRLCPQKGQVLIPPVVAGLRREFPELKVILIGDGESRQAVESAIAASNVKDVIEVRGWVPNDEVLASIANCRALLLPSYAEGLPIVIMEALALGRPAISTTVAGIPELVDESCGWLFDPGNKDQMAAAIKACLICPSAKLAQMGLAGRARVAALHDGRALARFLYDRFGCAVAKAAPLADPLGQTR
jgi:colanic acid/amylovoran biosynthesis glycosyltransferase